MVIYLVVNFILIFLLIIFELIRHKHKLEFQVLLVLFLLLTQIELRITFNCVDIMIPKYFLSSLKAKSY